MPFSGGGRFARHSRRAEMQVQAVYISDAAMGSFMPIYSADALIHFLSCRHGISFKRRKERQMSFQDAYERREKETTGLSLPAESATCAAPPNILQKIWRAT